MKKKIYEAPALEVHCVEDIVSTSGEFKDDNSLGWDTGVTSVGIDYGSFFLE